MGRKSKRGARRNATPKEVPIEERAWTPFERANHIRYQSEEHKQLAEKAMAETGEVCYVNSRYQVWVAVVPPQQGEGKYTRLFHLSFKRHDNAPIRDWRDVQRIKNELIGEEAEGVELYPAESRRMDTANQYHLWVFEEGTMFPFGFSGRLVLDEDSGDSVHKQRPVAEGETSGETVDNSKMEEMLKKAAAGDRSRCCNAPILKQNRRGVGIHSSYTRVCEQCGEVCDVAVEAASEPEDPALTNPSLSDWS